MNSTRHIGASLVAPALGLFWLCGFSVLRAEPVDDFAILDSNTTSPRYDTTVSPRDYRHQVSGYYFGDPG